MVKYLFHVKVFWERRHNTKQIIQCHRCQAWCHATQNCRHPPKCLKCGQGHLTQDCKITPESPATCANCGGNHPANNISCPFYINKIKQINENKEQRSDVRVGYVHNRNGFPALNSTRNFIMAPLPQTNPWNSQRSQPLTSQRPSRQQMPIPNINQNSAGDFANLMDVTQQLNANTNMSEMFRALNDYNVLLNGCTTKLQKFQATIEFFGKIESYDI